jgi:hypothetical protein
MIRQILVGAAAGAAGTTALNTATYLDMVWRGRPSSSTPEQTVTALADLAGVQVPGDDDVAQNRTTALGVLSGILTGVGVGALYGLARGLGARPGTAVGALLTTGGALAGSNGPMTLLGISDPRTWGTAAWVSDVVPHLAYGVVTAAVCAAAED